jgi:di/tricarboxylate transporter
MPEIFFTSGVIILMTIALIKDLYKPSFILFATLIALHLGGIITLKDTLAGFSNEGMLTVAVLFVVAFALQSSSSFVFFIERLLGTKNNGFIYFRLMLPVTFLSAFLNNTPIVASLIPVIKTWTKKNDLPASKFLIPLSYASILGGTCTLIGTSTNLVVHGLMRSEGYDGFSFFELGIVGLPIALIGILYFALIGKRFLPTRKDALVQLGESTREFVAEVKVEQKYPHVGKTIEDANLRHLKGLFLFQITRDGKDISSVSPDEKILLGDRLFFTGLPDTIYELLKTPGLTLVKDHEYDLQNLDSDKAKTFEAVISNYSPLVGQNVRNSKFRTKYNAVILAIHRDGHRINKKVGDIVFQPNDTLLILADGGFYEKWYHSTDFSLISPSISEYSKPQKKGNLALLLMALMITAVATGLIKSMFIAASITAGIMIVTNIVSLLDSKRAIDFDVLLTIASSFGIGKAVANSGLADLISHFLINSLDGFGVIAIIAGLFLITSFYTEIITNNAAAALIFPITLSTAVTMGVDPKPFMIVLAIAASSSFATPIGYQTNLMVYNPGGYRFADFLKTGIVMNVLVGVVLTVLIYLFYFASL